jgi:hypothetical protein
VDADAGRALSLVTGGDAYLRAVLVDARRVARRHHGSGGRRDTRARRRARLRPRRARRACARPGGASTAHLDALRATWRALGAALEDRARTARDAVPRAAAPGARARTRPPTPMCALSAGAPATAYMRRCSRRASSRACAGARAAEHRGAGAGACVGRRAGAGFEALTHVDDSFDDSGVRRALAARVGVRRRSAERPSRCALDAWGLQRRTEHLGGSAPPGQPDVAVRRTDRLSRSPSAWTSTCGSASACTSSRCSARGSCRGRAARRTRTRAVALPERHGGGAAARRGALGARRARRLAQHALILLGAERAVPQSREFFPLTVGWRF